MGNMENLQIRGNSFKLLAACFYEPDKQLFLDEYVCTNLAQLLKDDSQKAKESAEEMHTALNNESQEQLSIDHAALFVGPFQLISAPYGSVYLEKNRRIMGDSTIDALQYYKDEGLTLEVKEPPDHIAIQLEFMHYLCLQEALAIKEQDSEEQVRLQQVQKQFFHVHMSWVPEFSESMNAGATTQYYKSLASCLGHYYNACKTLYLEHDTP